MQVRVTSSACDSVLHIGPIEMKGNCADGERHTQNHENELIMEDTFCFEFVKELRSFFIEIVVEILGI